MIYEVSLYGELFGQETVNRWNYSSNGASGAVSGSFGLVFAMGFVESAGIYPSGGIFQGIRDLVSTAWRAKSVTARAVANYDVTDFYELPILGTITGGIGGDCMSPTQAFGLRSTRTRLDIDRGTKRFAGVPESSVGSGGTVDVAGGSPLTLLALRMSSALVYDDEGTTFIYQPCIVHKEKFTQTNGKPGYRYFPTLAQQELNLATGIAWQPYDRVRTQASRQYGRG